MLSIQYYLIAEEFIHMENNYKLCGVGRGVFEIAIALESVCVVAITRIKTTIFVISPPLKSRNPTSFELHPML